MFDIGFSELLVIGIVALIVVGPKDLPVMFHTLGRFTARARQLAREFSRALESAADEAGVKDVADDLRKATSPKSLGIDALKDAADKFEKWTPGEGGNKPPERGRVSQERMDLARKVNDTAKAEQQAELDAAAAEEVADWELEDKPAPKPAKKPAARKTTTKTAAKKPAAKTAAKKPAARAAGSPKTATTKTAAKKPAAPRKRAPAKKPAAAPDSDA